MKICILSAVILVLLTKDVTANELSADEQSSQSNLITTYDPGEASSNTLSFPHLPSNEGINTNAESQSQQRSVTFEDDKKDQKYIDIDKADPASLLADIRFDDEKNFNQNDRISNTRYERESNNPESKIKFEGNNEDQDDYEDQEDNDEEKDSQDSASQIVFDDNSKADENDSDYSDDSEIEAETSDKPIKFENQDNESNPSIRDSDRISVTERVVFKDDSNINRQPVQKKKRKQGRKSRFEGNQPNPASTVPNPSYPELGYPRYPGVGYPAPGYPGPGDPNYPGYPTPGYPNPGYPYPNYPSPYPGTAFPTSAYPGYLPYPSIYPPVNPGYGAYPTSGYQAPGDQRPPTNPIAHPSPGQGDPNGHADTRYPSPDYAGSPSPVASPPTAPQIGQTGPAYPGPEYPYYQGYPAFGYPPPYPVDPNSQYPTQNQAPYPPPVYPGLHQPGYPIARPSRRPKSLTQRAVSAVAEALTSIALYDDKQCVPRVLCEVAGGSSASSPSLVKASASLQPLLSLLQAYNGVSTSPLFIFGRAAVTGMTAKGNPSACYRAYPECPTDPEKLINYLNNHNGGFFRFFGLPETSQQPHNLEQFYNYLSGQTGLPQQQQPQPNYGYPRPYGYGFLSQNPYAHPYSYGPNYYNQQISYRNGKNIEAGKEEEEQIEGRIQNKPVVNVLEAESDSIPNESQDNGSKWAFPEEGSNKNGNERDKVKTTKRPKRPRQPERPREQDRPSRGSKTLKFPDDRSDDRRQIEMIRDYPRKDKRIHFPEPNNFQIITNYQTTTPVNSEEYYFDHKHNFYVKRPKPLKTDDVVYVVRGNGDPNHPESTAEGRGTRLLHPVRCRRSTHEHAYRVPQRTLHACVVLRFTILNGIRQKSTDLSLQKLMPSDVFRCTDRRGCDNAVTINRL
ncbi:hypothetical protein PYW08_008956 [Mythimna loreyi]|uniref:Uncharacterized protein n=1 Tax=Mythimna loreyi TaxID=667449 RepID=A0ACC2QBU8_9NEOP|nr:hypothetical protein PYW08_008956 [Mythimna loreyi]